MGLPILKLLGSAIAPFKWFNALCLDQTRIKITPLCAIDRQSDSLPVHDDGHRTGILLFAIATRSKHPVEITRVEVNFHGPLQLLDPGGRGFFKISGSLDLDFPFQVFWDGTASLRRDVQQAFALIARFPSGTNEYPICISVHARRLRSTIGGFWSHGRSRITTKRYRVVLTSEHILGLPLPPKCSQTTPQPFLIETAVMAYGGPGSVVVHEILADGTTLSNHVGLPDPNPRLQD